VYKFACFRVAKMNSDSNRPRSVVVKLRSARCRDSLIAAVQTYNRKNSNERLNTEVVGIGGEKKLIFVSEHLSPDKKSLHAATRLKAKELSYKFVWVRNGKIFVRKSENAQARLINSRHYLDKLE
jgi:hypothetical protein